MGVSDIVHGVLDVAGFIPVVGAAADIANAAVYAAEGDWANAALSAVSAVPVVGDSVAAVGKSAKLVKGAAKAAGWAAPKSKKMKALCGAMRGKAKTGAKKAFKKNSRKKALRRVKNKGKEPCLNGRCFTGDTLVCTKDGYRPIKDIRKGDDIYSRNAKTSETGLRKVEEVFRTGAHTIYHIWLDGQEELKTTAYHPLFVPEKGWVNAINLQECDSLETMEGTAHITKIVKVRHEEPVAVYNFHVEEWESYFVSAGRVYVHNGGHNHKKVSPAKVKELQNGPNGTAVNVETKADADALLKNAFPDYQKVKGIGSQDASGLRKLRKMQSFKKGGTYHKDYGINKKTGRVYGHDSGNPHGQYPHINIKRRDGKGVMINIVGRKK